VIRTGLDDGSARARTTRRIDALSRLLGWMNTGPKRYPDPDALPARFAAAGLAAESTPLHGNTPFNNSPIIATRPQPATTAPLPTRPDTPARPCAPAAPPASR